MNENSSLCPTVTVLVVTYNSSDTIVGTLNSIAKQSWDNLKLVITDDCSSDDTLVLCEEWIHRNNARFISTRIVKSNVRTGISANYNRGESACDTKWIKSIAGDDELLPDCIRDNIRYIQDKKDIVVLFSYFECFGSSDRINKKYEKQIDSHFFLLPINEQYKKLVFCDEGSYIPAPTCFYDVERLRREGISCDERIPMWDDYPRWLNILKKGIPLSFFPQKTVRYRLSPKSIASTTFYGSSFYRSQRYAYYYYQRDEYVQRYGENHTIELDVEYQVEQYNKYLQIRNLFCVKLYFKIIHCRYTIIKFLRKIISI